MSTKEEKTDFAQRLNIALKASHPSNLKVVKGGTDLARQFNLKHKGNSGVTPQAAHKWLTGQVIPTHDKIRTLAEWLGVSEHWLRYGPPPERLMITNQRIKKIKHPLSPQTLKLIENIETLPKHQRYLVEEIVREFLGNFPE